ncbi:hypothetical protein TEA_018471 [Camellia sinensis var. sinensis]|uniref:Uncharacterized protein n=1 Tax=Camellia sinensis var. sinensis TaxID=542762 RepID=A0A4S4CZF4_CAMSN|nr:hypothetical protein TEA_018471 [Camellia sinensis var. sinensis]
MAHMSSLKTYKQTIQSFPHLSHKIAKCLYKSWLLYHVPGSPPTMSICHPILFIIWVLSLLISFILSSSSSSWCPPHFSLQTDRQFEQKSDRFWEFEEQSNSWVEVELPYDLVSCVDGNCTTVGSIAQMSKKTKDHRNREDSVPEQSSSSFRKKDGGKGGVKVKENSDMVLPLRKRISLIKMSEASIWVTGASGSIYERFWNGVQWVIAPHDLPVLAGPANSVFMVNQTILALSEAGNLYQMHLTENSQPVWVDFLPTVDHSTKQEPEQNSTFQLKSGVISDDWEWVNHGRPPGANVAAIADAATVRPEVIFTLRSSKPSWKKHIWREGTTTEDTSLIPSKGCALHGFGGSHSVSLFLLTKGGNLVERRLHQRKWKWIVHGSPENHHLSSITSVSQDEFNEKTSSLFLTTASGSVLEYRVPKYSGSAQDNQIEENWVSHTHPPHAKLARGISGMQFQVGRIIFPLDDGRLAELHLPGLGGETAGPNYQINVRRKASLKYVWSILDSPETEGWNAEYCTEERGPTNCIMGIKDEPSDENVARSMSRGRKGSKEQQNYLSLGSISSSDPRLHTELYNMPANWINMNFRLRVMQGGRSFFLITDSGLTFEYLNTENVWIWLRHEHTTAMKGAVGYYNGSLFLVDEHGSLLIRERSSDGLAWINCTAMKKARPILGGPPWDKLPGKGLRVTAEDALFFVSKTGRLLQFTVALRKFKWKDCRNPPNTKVAGIVDQEIFRENIVFVIGRNGRLYQYNKVSEIWHEHRQSQHLVLSRLPGTAMRPSSLSLTGSLFMLSEDGGLVEYHWNGLDGWNWVEHGTPHRSVTLVGSPGPCFQGNQLFLIGSDGNVYLRYLDQTTWKWKNCGFPYMESTAVEDERPVGNEETCVDKDFATSFEKNDDDQNTFNGNCDSKVAPIRPIPFAEDLVVFELKDGRDDGNSSKLMLSKFLDWFGILN